MVELGVDRSMVEGNDQRKRLGIRLLNIDGVPRLCSLWNLRQESTMGAFGTQPAVLLTVALPQNSNNVDPISNNVDPIWLGSLFDLSPAEVRVASGLMRGDALRDLAISLRVSIEMVRSQFRSICAKTDTYSQSELVALLLKMSHLTPVPDTSP